MCECKFLHILCLLYSPVGLLAAEDDVVEKYVKIMMILYEKKKWKIPKKIFIFVCLHTSTTFFL